MKPSRQDYFNQYRENTLIEVVQAVAKSPVGANIAFKGGTALKFFYNLPRYSEDLDYDLLTATDTTTDSSKLQAGLELLTKKQRWEISDQAIKYHTILWELRFAGPEHSFHVKIEISTRKKKLQSTIQSLRGVPVLTLEPSLLMVEKLLAFLARNSGRDIFDAWFILQNNLPLDETVITEKFGNEAGLHQALLAVIEKTDPKKVLRDTGKLLGLEYRNWIKTSFLADFGQLVRQKLAILKMQGK